MPHKPSTLAALIACLRGRPPADVDWMDVIALANQSLTIAALAVAMSKVEKRDAVPDDVWAYFSVILARNVERNRRLAAQLGEAVGALREAGLEPLLLKGAVTLALGEPDRIAARMLSDLDLMLAPADVKGALRCLQRLDYEVVLESPNSGSLLAARLSRPQDVGVIDLHQRLLLNSKLLRPEIDAHCRLAASASGRVLVPCPALQLLIYVLHDQLHDGDYWTGRIELRHLLDMAALAEAPEGIDWERLERLLPGRLARNALETQLVTMKTLIGAPVPSRLSSGLWPRLQHQRRMLQLRLPLSRFPFFLATVALEARNYTSHSAHTVPAPASAFQGGRTSTSPIARRLHRLRRLMTAPVTSKL